MPWLKKAAEAPTVDKIWELSNELYRLYDASLHYCARELTDGHIPASRISPLTPKPATKQQIEALVKRRLWHRLPDICSSCLRWRKLKGAGALSREGYVVHDFLEFNPSRAQWEKLHERRVEGGSKGAQARWGEMAPPIGQAIAQPIGQPIATTHRSGHDPLSTETDSPTHRSADGPYSVPRSPSRSDNEGTADDPEIPDAPELPEATDRKRSGTGALRPLTSTVDRVVTHARARSGRG